MVVLPFVPVMPEFASFSAGTPVEIRAQSRQRAPSVSDLCPRHTCPRLLGRGVTHYRNRALLDGGIDVAIPVGRFAFHRHEGESGLHPPRVVFEALNLGIAGLGENLRTIQ